MSQVRTRSHTQSHEERVQEAESSNGWTIFLLHCSPQETYKQYKMKVKVLHAKRCVIPMKVNMREHYRITILLLQSLRQSSHQAGSPRRVVGEVKVDQRGAQRRSIAPSSSPFVWWGTNRRLTEFESHPYHPVSSPDASTPIGLISLVSTQA